MKRLFLTLFFIVFFSSKSLSEWVLLGNIISDLPKNKGENLVLGKDYIDLKTIKLNNEMVYYKTLIDFKVLKSIGFGNYYSTVGYYKGDCKNKHMMWLKIEFYKSPMAKDLLKKIDAKKVWEKLIPNSNNKRFFDFACAYIKNSS